MIEEAETDALRRFLRDNEGDRVVSSALVRTELRRAVLRFIERTTITDEEAQELALRGAAVLRGLDLVRVSATVLDLAGAQRPAGLRSLDAIHLATALRLGSQLDAVVAYDHRLTDATRSAGLVTLAP